MNLLWLRCVTAGLSKSHLDLASVLFMSIVYTAVLPLTDYRFEVYETIYLQPRDGLPVANAHSRYQFIEKMQGIHHVRRYTT